MNRAPGLFFVLGGLGLTLVCDWAMAADNDPRRNRAPRDGSVEVSGEPLELVAEAACDPPHHRVSAPSDLHGAHGGGGGHAHLRATACRRPPAPLVRPSPCRS